MPLELPLLTANARTVLEKRYLRRGALGRPQETPTQLFERVAAAVADAEPARQRRQWNDKFLDLMLTSRFLPNSPTLMNAGIAKGQLSACFVLPLEDSLEGIFETLKQSALIHQSGGGTGFAFSRLRPKGAIVRSTQGVASGPVSFLRIFDASTETIKQGGTRRGANMAVLRVDHPDILEFIDVKKDMKSITNFNLSVGITDEFMDALRESRNFELRDPSTESVVTTLAAREIWSRILESAWICGDPGLVFLDRIAKMNPTPRVGEMESTNPCGEQPLLPYESCNLGSINVALYWKDGMIDWTSLRADIHTAVRFLDNVIEVNHFPVAACARVTRANRKIGLGVMGFADLLLLMGFAYDSDEGRTWGERLMSFVDREAKRASAELAREQGAFPNFKDSLWADLGYPPLRNATVTTVAPTGTISIIAGASSGIEPIFSAMFTRNVLSGDRLVEVHPSVERALRDKGVAGARLEPEELSRVLGSAWSPAHLVSVEGHVRMQAAFQRFSDSGVSKTVNLPESATVADIGRAYQLAYDVGCKGITVYRDRSRPEQVLEAAYCPSC